MHLPPDGGAEEAGLVDGLGRAETVKLFGAIGRYGQHGYPGVMGFNDRRVQFGGGRAARGYDRCRHPCGRGQTDGEEAGRTLVGQHVKA